MIKFLRKLFCFGHDWEVEQSLLDGEYYEVCRKCGGEEMTELRKQFEAMPEIVRIVSCDEIKWCNVYNWYRTDNTDANSIYHVAWLNGAWYAFQEQQKKIDEFVNIIRDAYMSNGNSSVEIVYDKIQELLK